MGEVLIIGGGEMGQAMRGMMDPSLGAVIYDRDPARGTDKVTLESAVPKARYIFICVPTWAVRDVVKAAAPLARHGAIWIALSKGLERETYKFAYEIISEYVPKERVAVLAGPMLAEELAKGELGGAVLAASDAETISGVTRLFSAGRLLIERSGDLRSVALSSVLKNIYSLALGVAQGLGWGNNRCGIVAARAIQESRLVARLLGADPEAILSLSGLGDLVATGMSPHSSNREAGLRIAEGKEPGYAEGLVALPSLIALLGGPQQSLPLFSSLYEIAAGGKDARDVFTRYIHG